MKIYHAAIFDMDGTLTDTLADLHVCMNEMLARYDFPPITFEQVKVFVGNGARKFLTRSLPADVATDENFVAEAFAQYNEIYIGNCVRHVKPYAGIMELLTALAAKKIPLGICTNKQHPAAIEIAEKILAPIEFGCISGDDPGQPRKPDPTRALACAKILGVEPADVAYFGDTAVDIDTAHNAGFLAVGVTWGFRPRAELVDARADIIVDSPQEILTRIEFGGSRSVRL